MSAPTAPKKSKAARFADAAQALGWTVQREKTDDVGGRKVTAKRGAEVYQLRWSRTPEGRENFLGTEYSVGGEIQEKATQLVVGVLRAMEEPERTVVTRADTGKVVRLTFDPATATPVEVRVALEGRTIKWINRIKQRYAPGEDFYESATLPDNRWTTKKRPDGTEYEEQITGKHTECVYTEHGQMIISFASLEMGFRCVNVNDIVGVS